MTNQPIEPFHAPDLMVRLETGGAFIAAGEQSVETLIAALRHPDIEICWRAVVALGWIGDARALDALVGLLDNPTYEIKVSVVWALGQLGDPRAVHPLLDILHQEDASNPDMAYLAALALLRFGLVEPLRNTLDSPHDYHFRAAH